MDALDALLLGLGESVRIDIRFNMNLLEAVHKRHFYEAMLRQSGAKALVTCSTPASGDAQPGIPIDYAFDCGQHPGGAWTSASSLSRYSR